MCVWSWGQSMTWAVVYLLIQFYKHLHVAFLNLSPKCFLVFWTFPFQSSGQKLEFSYPILPCTSLNLTASRATLRGADAKRNRITPPSWDQSSSDPQRFLSEFWFLPPAASASVTKAKGLLRSWDEREWALGVPVPTPCAHIRGLFLGSTLPLWALMLSSGF